MVGGIIGNALKQASKLKAESTTPGIAPDADPTESSSLVQESGQFLSPVEDEQNPFFQTAKSLLIGEGEGAIEVEAPGILNLKPHHKWMLDELAAGSGKSEPSVDDYAGLAMQGKASKDIATEEIQQNVAKKSQELLTEAIGKGLTDPMEIQDYVENRLKGLTPESSKSSRILPSGVIDRFGPDLGMRIVAGEINPADVGQIAPKLSSDELSRAIGLYEQMLKNPPKKPDGTPLGQLSDTQLAIMAIGAILAPNSVTDMLIAPIAFLHQEKARRDAENAKQFESDVENWQFGVKSQAGVVDSLIDREEFMRRDETTRRGQDMAKERVEIQQNAQNERAWLTANTRLTVEDKKQASDALEVLLDDRYDANVRRQAFDVYTRLTGRNPFNPASPIEPGYREEKGRAETVETLANADRARADIGVKNSQAAYNWARVNLTEEQAKKVAVEASLLPEKFNFEVWKASEQFAIDRAKGTLDEKKLSLDALKAASSSIDDTRKAFLETAAEKNKAAQNKELEAAATTDEAVKAQLLKDANDLRGDATKAMEAADKLKTESDVVYGELSKRYSAPTGAFQNLGSRFKSGFEYSMDTSGPESRAGDKAVDCSSFVCRAYSEAGIDVKMNTAEGLWNSFERLSQPKMGSSVFFKDNKASGDRKNRDAHHVGILVRQLPNGDWIMRHASSANDAVVDVTLSSYLSGTKGRMELLGYGMPKNIGGSVRSASKLADHTSTVAAQYGLPADPNKFVESVLKPGSGWSQFDPKQAGLKMGDVLVLEDPDTTFRSLMIDSITEKDVVLRAGGKTFRKPLSWLQQKIAYFRPPTNRASAPPVSPTPQGNLQTK